MLRLIYFLIFLILFSCAAFTQIEKGKLAVGGDVGMSFHKNVTDSISNFKIYWNPHVGFLVSKNVELGVGPFISYEQEVNKSTNASFQSLTGLGLQPYFKFHYPIAKRVYFNAYASPAIGVYITKYSKDPSQPKVIQPLISWSLGPGLSIFLNDHVALVPSLYYQGSWSKTNIKTTAKTLVGQSKITHGVLFNIGLAIYLDKKDKK